MRSDRSILVGLGLVALLAAFWFVILAPKREQASELESEVTSLEASVADYDALAVAAEEAEANFDRNYTSLVVLGKAVPSDSDTSSLFVQLNELAEDAEVKLGSIELAQEATAPPPPPPVAETAGEEAPEPEAADTATVPTAAATTPTEAVASTLPLGATVGPAGLPVMPYSLSLDGSFFGLADFLKGVDDLVGFADGKPAVNGRLLTIDGFTITSGATDTDEPGAADASSAGDLVAELSVTSYVSPADQGATAGATPAGPAPPASTPVSTTPPPAAVTP